MSKTVATPGFLLLLATLASILLALIIAPFAASLFAAAVLAGVLYPLQSRFETAIGGKRNLAASVLTILVTTLAVAPLAALCVFVARQLTGLYSEVTVILKRDGVEGLIEEIPRPLQGFARRAVEWVPGNIEDRFVPRTEGATSTEGLSPAEIGAAADVATTMLDGLFGILLDFAVVVVALFFLLSQGGNLVRWIVGTLPLSDEQSDRLVAEFRDVTRSVFAATVATAFLQTALAGLGYWIAGIPYLPIALLLTFVCALVPVIGAATVVGGIGLLLALSNSIGYGVFLLAWSVAVGLSDNVVKPWFVKGDLRLPGSVVLFAMLGGVTVFGPFGIIAGPLIVAFFLASLRLLRQEGIVPDPAEVE